MEWRHAKHFLHSVAFSDFLYHLKDRGVRNEGSVRGTPVQNYGSILGYSAHVFGRVL